MTTVTALVPEPSAQSVPSDELLSFCKATADGLRLDVLRLLRDESFGVMELCHIFSIPQPGMSHHLKVLATAGLVETRREGNSIFYRRSMIVPAKPLSDLVTSFFDAIDRVPLSTEALTRMGEVHEERARSSLQFFEKNADRLKENQSLIAEFSHYSGCVRDLLSNEQIPASGHALEIGPGDSELINLLASSFERVTALDNAEGMLAKAQAALDPAHVSRVNFHLGEPGDLVREGKTFDLLVLNMVLHHLPSPARLFRDAQALLTDGGYLLIIDLRPHNQDWARDICGDLWLGFEPQDLDTWAGEAGLEKGQGVYLGLKNGFQVQVRLYRKPSNQPTGKTGTKR